MPKQTPMIHPSSPDGLVRHTDPVTIEETGQFQITKPDELQTTKIKPNTWQIKTGPSDSELEFLAVTSDQVLQELSFYASPLLFSDESKKTHVIWKLKRDTPGYQLYCAHGKKLNHLLIIDIFISIEQTLIKKGLTIDSTHTFSETVPLVLHDLSSNPKHILLTGGHAFELIEGQLDRFGRLHGEYLLELRRTQPPVMQVTKIKAEFRGHVFYKGRITIEDQTDSGTIKDEFTIEGLLNGAQLTGSMIIKNFKHQTEEHHLGIFDHVSLFTFESCHALHQKKIEVYETLAGKKCLIYAYQGTVRGLKEHGDGGVRTTVEYKAETKTTTYLSGCFRHHDFMHGKIKMNVVAPDLDRAVYFLDLSPNSLLTVEIELPDRTITQKGTFISQGAGSKHKLTQLDGTVSIEYKDRAEVIIKEGSFNELGGLTEGRITTKQGGILIEAASGKFIKHKQRDVLNDAHGGIIYIHTPAPSNEFVRYYERYTGATHGVPCKGRCYYRCEIERGRIASIIELKPNSTHTPEIRWQMTQDETGELLFTYMLPTANLEACLKKFKTIKTELIQCSLLTTSSEEELATQHAARNIYEWTDEAGRLHKTKKMIQAQEPSSSRSPHCNFIQMTTDYCDHLVETIAVKADRPLLEGVFFQGNVQVERHHLGTLITRISYNGEFKCTMSHTENIKGPNFHFINGVTITEDPDKNKTTVIKRDFGGHLPEPEGNTTIERIENANGSKEIRITKDLQFFKGSTMPPEPQLNGALCLPAW